MSISVISAATNETISDSILSLSDSSSSSQIATVSSNDNDLNSNVEKIDSSMDNDGDDLDILEIQDVSNTLEDKDQELIKEDNSISILKDDGSVYYISVSGTGDGSSINSPAKWNNRTGLNNIDASTIYFLDGNYSLVQPKSTYKSGYNVINLTGNKTIKAVNPGKAIISAPFNIKDNGTYVFEDLIFTGVYGNSTKGAPTVTINNCNSSNTKFTFRILNSFSSYALNINGTFDKLVINNSIINHSYVSNSTVDIINTNMTGYERFDNNSNVRFENSYSNETIMVYDSNIYADNLTSNRLDLRTKNGNSTGKFLNSSIDQFYNVGNSTTSIENCNLVTVNNWGSLTINNSSFNNGSNNPLYGRLSNSEGNVTINDVIFNGYHMDSFYGTFNASNIMFNSTGYVQFVGSEAEIHNMTFLDVGDNVTYGISVTNSSVMIDNTEFYNRRSGIVVNDDISYLSVRNSKFINNSNNLSGGSIKIGDMSNDFKNYRFYYAEVPIYLPRPNAINSLDSSVLSVSPILEDRLSNGIYIYNSSFENSESKYGGAISNIFDYEIIVENCNFTNSSARYGGSIYSVNGSLYILNSNITDSESKFFGGGVYSDTKLSIIDSTFANNSANVGNDVFSFTNLTVKNSTVNQDIYLTNITFDGFVDLTESPEQISEGNTNYRYEYPQIVIGAFENYTSFCIEKNQSGLVYSYYDNDGNYTIDGIYNGTFVKMNTSIAINNIDEELVNDYIKILLYKYYPVDGVINENALNLSDLQKYIWAFTDEDYNNINSLWAPDEKSSSDEHYMHYMYGYNKSFSSLSKDIIEDVINEYNNGLRIPDERAIVYLENKTYENGTTYYVPTNETTENVLVYDFAGILVANAQNQLGVKTRIGTLSHNLTKETLNKTVKLNETISFRLNVTNTGNISLINITISDKNYTSGLEYLSWENEVGNWTYNNQTWLLNTPLEAGKSASIIVTFNATSVGFKNNTATVNSSDTNNTTSTNNTTVVYYNFDIVKETCNSTVELGELVEFEYKRVKNTGC